MSTNTSNIRILLVGGGTGGHFYPLMSIAEALNTLPEKPRLYYAGPERYDEGALDAQNISYVAIPAGKKRRYFSFLNFFDAFKTFLGLLVAIIRLYSIYPDVIVSKGGYTSVPITLAARFLMIPVIIHESDAVMGKANKLAVTFARAIIVAYDELAQTLQGRNVLLLGIPIRTDLMAGPTPNAIASLGISEDRPVLLILGGSQGAERINEFILHALDNLLTTFTVIHQTGKQHIDLCTQSANTLIPDPAVRQYYHPVAFLGGPMLNDAYHVASVVISRAGSNSIYEIALHGKPSILIPIPEEVSHDQRTNAYAYARNGGATIMEEGNLTDSLLRAEIDRIMQSDEIYSSMVHGATTFAKRDAATRISALILETAQTH